MGGSEERGRCQELKPEAGGQEVLLSRPAEALRLPLDGSVHPCHPDRLGLSCFVATINTFGIGNSLTGYPLRIIPFTYEGEQGPNGQATCRGHKAQTSRPRVVNSTHSVVLS